MKTLKRISALVLFICAVSFGFAQQGQYKEMTDAERQEMKAEIQAKKVEYIKERLKLTDAESKAFFPVYESFQKQMDELKPEFKGEKLSKKDMSDDELVNHMKERLNLEEKALSVKKEYLDKFLEVLPVQKVAQLQKIEHEFHKEMFGDKEVPNKPKPAQSAPAQK